MEKKAPSDKNQLKVTFVTLWTEIKEQAEQKINFGKELKRQGAWEKDVAEQFLSGSSIVDFGGNIEGVMDYGSQLQLAQSNQLSNLQGPINYGGTAVYSSASVVQAFEGFSSINTDYLQPQDQERIKKVRTGFTEIFDRHDKKAEVLGKMHFLGFDRRQDGQNAIHQFKSAWEEHEQSPSTPTSTLIPMRQAIASSINELLKRRPSQGPAKNKVKIIEIGSQLAAPGIDKTFFETLQQEWEKLNDTLSSYKEPKGTRQAENAIMMTATLFLIQLLNAVDTSKLRP